MKNCILFLTLILFAGCVDVKIKSEIPKKTYYDLDVREVKSRHCSRLWAIGLSEVSSISSMDSKNIIQKKSNGETTNYENMQWVDNPKSMFKTMLLKQAYAKCLDFEKPSLRKIERFLSVEILFLGFLDSKPSIEFVYKISDEKFNLIDMGIIKKSHDSGTIADLQQLTQESIDGLINLLQESKVRD